MNRLCTLLLILLPPPARFPHSTVTAWYIKKNDQIITFYADGTYKYVLWPCDICPQLTPGNVQSFGTYEKDSSSYYLFPINLYNTIIANNTPASPSATTTVLPSVSTYHIQTTKIA